jgi:trk system potassium uptake protein TrkA
LKIVIVGAGEVGFHVASRLSLENKDVMVVDTSDEALKRVSENLDVQVVKGSGSSPEVLIDAGIRKADILLAVTDSDETNLVACLTCDMLSPATKKLARIRHSDYDAYHEHFRKSAPHIDTIINPEIEVVKTIYRLMRVPGAVDVNEFEGGRVKIVGMRLEEGSILAGLRLADLPARLGGIRPLIAAIVRKEQLIVPHGNDTLKTGDLVYFISEATKLNDVLRLFNRRMKPVNRVLIVGGGRIGTRLADFLETKNIHTKIVEKDSQRCRFLAERMNRAVVLCGDGSDQSLLLEENVKGMDFVVSLTDDEETNILVSLLARSMGAENTITKISKFTYLPLMSTIGVEQVVSPRLSAINSIQQHIRKGKVLSAISVHGEQAEVIEAVALQTSELVDTPISKVSFPKGALLICIIRDEEVIIPSGESVIQPDDRVIIFATREAVPRIEKMLTVKLEFF